MAPLQITNVTFHANSCYGSSVGASIYLSRSQRDSQILVITTATLAVTMSWWMQ